MSNAERRRERRLEEKNRSVSGTKITQAKQELSIHSGPIPPPEQLIRYNDAAPNAADRIIKMAEEQLEHRRMLETTALKVQARNSTLGVVFGFILGMTTILCGTALSWHGSQLAGFASVLLGLASLVGVFVYQKKSKN